MGKRAHIEEAKTKGWGRMVAALCLRKGKPATAWRNPEEGLRWALDNGAFSLWQTGQLVDVEAFAKLLRTKLVPDLPPDFIVVPDRVAHPESLRFSLDALAHLPEGLPYYLAVQDGMQLEEVAQELHQFAGIFVGGTKAWKLRTLRQWSALAHEHGIKCHVARVASHSELVACELAGVDSIDTTSFVQNETLQRLRDFEWWSERGRQTQLIDGFDATKLGRERGYVG